MSTDPPSPGGKTYIGDGVYAEFDPWGGLVLTTEDGISVQNRVVLEPREWRTLLEWVDRFWAAQKAEVPEP